MWSDVTSPPVVTTCPTSLGDMDISQQHPEVLSHVHLRVQ